MGETPMAEGEVCVVTGGRGFAARHLVEMLIKSPHRKWSVRIADLAPSIKLDPHEEQGILGNSLRSGQAIYVSADLRNKTQVIQAFQGADVVFHMAAPDSSINNYQLHHSVNVLGTKNVIDACIECKVKRLIYTSSPSVVFDGIHGIHNGDESLPYPDTYNDSYSATKAEAEALVRKSNGKGGLLTCCIRPSSIFGPGDKLLVPSLVAAARAGKSKFIVGDGNNMYDFTYVENVAHAHICAEQSLASKSNNEGTAAGKAYFVTNMEPIKFWEFTSMILEALGYERPRIHVPVSLMMPIALLVERTYKMLAPCGMPVPQLTPSRIRLLTCNRTFNCSRARDELGYEPIVPLQEGLERTIQSYSSLRAGQPTESKVTRDSPSKASMYLGGGKVADILLWKDKKQTLSVLLSLLAVYFFTSGYTMVTAVSKILLVMTVVLFVHNMLPTKILGYRVEKIPDSFFQFSEEMAHHIAASLGVAWNAVANVIVSLCKGKDWMLLLKVVLLLSVINLLGEVPWQISYLTVVFCIFTGFYIYDTREEEIDHLIQQAPSKLKSFLTINQPATGH